MHNRDQAPIHDYECEATPTVKERYTYGSTGFAAVSQLFCNEGVLYVFFAISNTMFEHCTMNNFMGYDLADLFDRGQ